MGLKLSEIFDRYEKIKSLDPNTPKELLINFINEFKKEIESINYVNHSEFKKLEHALLKNLDDYLKLHYETCNKLKATIDNNTLQFLETNTKIYSQNIEQMLFEEHLEWIKLWPPSDLEYEHFFNQIKQFVNWQYPGLIFGANNTNMIKALIGLEPIYIIEKYIEYFKLQKDMFNTEFSRKLRFYNINSISILPKNALGLVAIYNQFNFLPWSYITHVLDKFATALQPNGVIIFTYNNCDTAKGFKEFENCNMTYTTPKMYIDFLTDYDLELINEYTSSRETFSFMIFKKTGNKLLIKKNPSIGYIRQQSNLNTISHKTKIDTIRKLIDKH